VTAAADIQPAPEVLRQYALVADGERGALIGPRGDIAFLCAPRWHDDAVFSGLLGGPGGYAVTPADGWFVWGGHYEQDTLIWRSRWVGTDAVTECREALAFPGDPDCLVLLRRIEALDGITHVRVSLDVRAGFGSHPMTLGHSHDGVWRGQSGDLGYRWSGPATRHAHLDGGRLVLELVVPAGESRDLVLEISRADLPQHPPDPELAWARTERAWRHGVPDLEPSAAPGESRHSYAVLRGLTSATGGMVAAASASLPERAEQGRNYDYRYAWIRDQCYAGRAAAVVGDTTLLDAAVRFVTARVLEDGPDLAPGYTVEGGAIPHERDVALPGYPGAPVRVGNWVRDQLQLDAFGEALLLLSAAHHRQRLDDDGREAITTLVGAIEKRADEPDAGIWELAPRRWAHSRLMCAAGLRAASGTTETATRTSPWTEMADALVRSVDRDCLHRTGRWQRSPDDADVDAALLLPGIRGAVPADDPRHTRTVAAVISDLTDDGYVYRFRHDAQRPLHESEGAFLLCGFHLALAQLGQGRREDAVRWFERTRSALGPPGLFTEEFDVVERQLRGNLPQAFVHALLLETAHALGASGVGTDGFQARDR
jgi:GH15 family glucan-1,4-alpha-glucosidase